MMRPASLRSGIRIASLDAWRGLAALMVVAFHATVPALINTYPELQNDLLYRYVVFGNYSVQIFLVVSGLCVAQAALRSLDRPSPLAMFIRARVRRIYPPYVAASLLSVLLSAIAAYMVARHIIPFSSLGAEQLFARSPRDYACSVLLLQLACHVSPLVPVFWTLCYEAAFYVWVAGTIAVAVMFRRDRLILDLCHALTLACSVALLVVPAEVHYPFDLWPHFGLGVIALDILTLRRRLAYGVLLITVILQLGYAAGDLGMRVNYQPTHGVAALVAVAFCLFLVAAHGIDDRLSRLLPVRLLAYVGVFSYSLYVSHWLVLGPVGQIMKKLYVTSASLYWISALAQIVAAVLVARLFYAVAERPFLTRRRVRIDLEATAGLTVAPSLPHPT